ncbi:MAG: hypothetical protein HY868_16455 [Chloroflexi bacterium]|nr:hypothetical protein [Chloroflexota bacterium]
MSNRYFPFHALGLQCNPFRALTDDEWADIAVLPDAFIATIERDNAHVQILGARGFGKTTMLLALAARFKRAGKRVAYEYRAEGQSRFTTDADSLDVFLLDEAQRLGSRERNRLLGAASHTRLVLGTHTDFTREFARHGLPLTALRLEPATAAHLAAILQTRLDYFARGESRAITFTPDAIQFLSQRFGGDLRALDHFLYDVFQRLERAEPITAERLRAIL